MGEPRLILVVDDNQVIAMTVEETLRDAGYAVLTVNSGEEACWLIDHADQLAAVVTDIRLEADTDGWEVARHAREVHPDVAVVYISGRDAAQHEGCGVSDSCMLPKPFGCTRLVAAVTEGIERAVATRH